MVKFTQAIVVLVSLVAHYTPVEGNGIRNRNKLKKKVRGRINRNRGGKRTNKLRGGYNKSFQRDNNFHNVRTDAWDEREDFELSSIFSMLPSSVQDMATSFASDHAAGMLDEYDPTGMASCAVSAMPQIEALADGIQEGELAALSQAVTGCVSTKLQNNPGASPCVLSLATSSNNIIQDYWAGTLVDNPIDVLVCSAEQISKSCDAIPDFDISNLKDMVPSSVASMIPGFDRLPDCSDVTVPPSAAEPTTTISEAPPPESSLPTAATEPATGESEAPPPESSLPTAATEPATSRG